VARRELFDVVGIGRRLRGAGHGADFSLSDLAVAPQAAGAARQLQPRRPLQPQLPLDLQHGLDVMMQLWPAQL
jgi:hypothetical protein